MAFSLFLLTFHLIVLQDIAAVIVFDPPPTNTTVIEGEMATFTCAPKTNGTTIVPAIVWSIDPPDGPEVPVYLSNTTNLAGASGVFQSGDETQIFVTGVQRGLDGAEVKCEGRSFIERLTAPVVFLAVQAAPGAPKGLILSKLSPFSVQVNWSAPSDAGNPPDPLTYTVTLTNITDGTVLQYTLPSTQITLSNLLPGVQYNVSVYAKNSVASGPSVTGVFRTNNSVPIIKQATLSVYQSSLFIHVTLVTNGGIPILAYHVSFNGQTTTYSSAIGAHQTGMSLKLANLMLRHGEVFPLSIQVENSIGNSTRIDVLAAVIGPSAEKAAAATDDVKVPVLSIFVGLLGTLTLTAIVASVTAGVCACRNRKSSKVCRKDSLPSLSESPVEFKDVNERKSQEQERSVQPLLQPNPSYEPLNVNENPADLSDTHKKNSASQEQLQQQGISVDPILQPNPSYEPLNLHEPNFLQSKI